RYGSVRLKLGIAHIEHTVARRQRADFGPNLPRPRAEARRSCVLYRKTKPDFGPFLTLRQMSTNEEPAIWLLGIRYVRSRGPQLVFESPVLQTMRRTIEHQQQ